MPTEVWPRAGQRVDLVVDETDEQLLAVVDDVRAPEQLHLREPVRPDGSSLGPVPVGTPLTLLWTSPAGQHVLRAVLAALPETRVVLWRLAPVADVEVVQRREFVRVPETLRVELRRGDEQWHGGLCDLSEGGARCVVVEPNDLSEGDELEVHVDIDDRHLQVAAVVLDVAAADERRTTTRLRFGELRRDADVIRRRVLDVQRRARAAGLR